MNEDLGVKPIVLEPAQYEALAEIAEWEGQSVAEVAREMIQRELEQRQQRDRDLQERRRVALAEIRRHRAAILEANGGQPLDFDAVAVINEMREERDAEVLGLVSRCDW
jgi:hypothetical protein